MLKDQNKAATLLQHFGSIANLARASVQDLSAFLSRDKAAQLVSSLRLGGRRVALGRCASAKPSYQRLGFGSRFA